MMPRLLVHSLLLAFFCYVGCAKIPHPASATPTNAAHTLGELFLPMYRTVGKQVDAISVEDAHKVGESCSWESTAPTFTAQAALQTMLDSISHVLHSDFEEVCAATTDTDITAGEAHFVVDLGRHDDHLISLVHTATIVYPGGKAHPITASIQYDPRTGRQLAMPTLFSLQTDALYPLLRRLVLAEIESKDLLEDAEKVLFDNGAQTTEEVLTTFLVTEDALVCFFGPGQCRQLYWAETISVELPWDTEI
jgi:hypothetical protein